MATPNLAIIHIAAAQNQKEVTANTAFDDLDLALTNETAIALASTSYVMPQATAAENMVFIFSGTISGTGVVTLPTKRLYVVANETNHSLLFQSNVPGRTAVVLAQAAASIYTPQYTILYCDGVNVDVVSQAASGFTNTIASGTAALGTGAISSGTAATTVTVAATGVLATDNVMADFNGDPTGTTGYAPNTNGMLTIIKWCSAGAVNFKVVNNTANSITPGSITLNWRVVR